MACDPKKLFISDDFMTELMGWKEVCFLGPFGGSLKPQEQEKCREDNFRFLRRGPILVDLQKSLAYSIYHFFNHRAFCSDPGPSAMTKRSTKNIPLASVALRHLILEADKFNNTANNVVVLDKLKAVGNPVQFSDREKVIDALQLTREDIIRAIKTERILRENPNFRPEQFSNNIAALKAMQIRDKANNYGKYFDETMQVAISIQNELKSLFAN